MGLLNTTGVANAPAVSINTIVHPDAIPAFAWGITMRQCVLKVEEPIFLPEKYDDHGKWMDGWESKRRRIPGNDHCIIRLGTKGVIKGININTKFFTGNHPPRGSLEGTFSAHDPNKNSKWIEILWIDNVFEC